MTPALLALLVLASSGRTPAILTSSPVRAELRVESGRAGLVLGAEVRSLTRLSGLQELEGEAYIEVGARSTLSLRWPGMGSVLLAGPAALRLDGARLVLGHFRVLELEVRRGNLALELPGGFALDLGAGALRATSLPHGGTLLLNRGGGALEIRARDSQGVRAIRPGGELRLRGRL